MSSNGETFIPAITVRDVSKSYTISHRPRYRSTLGEAVATRIRHPFRRAQTETFWALRDATFFVERGSVVGIIGRNGAGKSTLLKILSRITPPTTGRVDLYGRVGSLLEVGTGFHPELTGRENIYLNGSILGMRRSEIESYFDEIIDFAEVDEFLDTPVKRYSSGMYVRLAFAVAAHLKTEILIVDEVLSVGDAQFQKKCLGKLGQVVSQQGRTVLFVSHNMTAVQSLCNRAVWLQSGRVVADGPVQSVVGEYLRSGVSSQGERVWAEASTAPGNYAVRVRRVCVRPADGAPRESITVRTPIDLEFEYWNLEEGTHLSLSLHVFNANGVRLFNTFPSREPAWHGRPFPRGLYKSVCRIPGDVLNDGAHRVQLQFMRDQTSVVFNLEDALVFEVADAPDFRGAWHGRWEGAVRPNLDWATERLPAPESDMAIVGEDEVSRATRQKSKLHS